MAKKKIRRGTNRFPLLLCNNVFRFLGEASLFLRGLSFNPGDGVALSDVLTGLYADVY